MMPLAFQIFGTALTGVCAAGFIWTAAAASGEALWKRIGLGVTATLIGGGIITSIWWG